MSYFQWHEMNKYDLIIGCNFVGQPSKQKVVLQCHQWEAINRKQITRWQHVFRLKAGSFGSW
jgi:hypothetical protein